MLNKAVCLDAIVKCVPLFDEAMLLYELML